MAPDDVLLNMTNTQNYIDGYLRYFHPAVMSHVKFEVENPWHSHDPITVAVLDHFSQHLTQAQDEHIKKNAFYLEGAWGKTWQRRGS